MDRRASRLVSLPAGCLTDHPGNYFAPVPPHGVSSHGTADIDIVGVWWTPPQHVVRAGQTVLRRRTVGGLGGSGLGANAGGGSNCLGR